VTPNQLVAYNMRRIRRSRGLTQEQLGDRLSWSHASVSAAERSVGGKRVKKFDADEIVAIAGALGIDAADLLAGILPCAHCNGEPPAGFTCQACGTEGDTPGGAT
jgi:transcriptional regulator with XRE-family HTH domain